MRPEIDDPGVPAGAMRPVSDTFQTGEDEGCFPTLGSMDWEVRCGRNVLRRNNGSLAHPGADARPLCPSVAYSATVSSKIRR